MRYGALPSILAVLGAAVAHAQMGPAAVVVAPVVEKQVELTERLVATVEPVTRSTLATEQEGIVAERLFDEGQRVEQGQVLVRLNTDLLSQQRDAAAAALKAAENELAAAKLTAENDARERKRLEDLVRTRAVSERDYDAATTRALVSQSTVAVRQADLTERQAELDRLNLQLAKSEVRSPLAGVVASRRVEVGQWLQQGDPVAEVVQLDPLFVRVAVPEAIAPHTIAGAKAAVVIDALDNQEFEATVDQVLPEADPNSRTVPVKLRLANPDLTIRPGFFARATLLSHDAAALFVPKDAVVPSDRGSHVVAVRDAAIPPGAPPGSPGTGKAAMVPVTRMHGVGDGVFVRGDLKPGDLVVIRGNEMLFPDQALMVLNPPPAGNPTEARVPAGAAPQPPPAPAANPE